jgi:hypothetical protein
VNSLEANDIYIWRLQARWRILASLIQEIIIFSRVTAKPRVRVVTQACWLLSLHISQCDICLLSSLSPNESLSCIYFSTKVYRPEKLLSNIISFMIAHCYLHEHRLMFFQGGVVYLSSQWGVLQVFSWSPGPFFCR